MLSAVPRIPIVPCSSQDLFLKRLEKFKKWQRVCKLEGGASGLYYIDEHYSICRKNTLAQVQVHWYCALMSSLCNRIDFLVAVHVDVWHLSFFRLPPSSATYPAAEGVGVIDI